MAIISGLTDTALTGLATKKYNFSTDTFKVALYTSSASLSNATTAYTSTNELSGGGYTAAGYTLTNNTPTVTNRTLLISWSDVTTGSLTQADIRGAMIYNSTVANEAIFLVDFGSAISRTAQTLTLKFLQVSGSKATIMISAA